MGKKEKIIKKLNNEFYKEYNRENEENEMIIESKEFDARREKEDKLYEDSELVSDVAATIIHEMKEHVAYDGLCLCENLDIINTENFIEYLKKSPTMISRDCLDETREPEDTRTLSEIQQSIREINKKIQRDDECINYYTKKIRSQGENILFDEFIDEYHDGEIPNGYTRENLMGIFRDQMIKMAKGEERYYDFAQDIAELYHEKLCEGQKKDGWANINMKIKKK